MAISNPRKLSFFYISFFFFIHFLCSNNNGGGRVEAFHRILPEFQSLIRSEVKGLRTGFHFQPRKHWINDPNGPMYFNGIYHLFYQYNPKGAVWGNIVWAHSVSKDLINWIPLQPAIYPSKPFDNKGCWSGSATILPGNKPVILYTGINKDNIQISNIAFPKNLSDPYLTEWIKPDFNPLMVPERGVNVSSYRDPTTAWKGADGQWRILVGSKRNRQGMALLYKSKDFNKWKIAAHPLHSAPNTGMWECPDFYPVSLDGNKNGLDTSVIGNGTKHVFKVSLDENRFDYYTVGTYDTKQDIYLPDHTSADNSTGLRYDYGNFYASKTFFDSGKNRRILWGWANESDTAAEDVAKGWAGIQAIPRVVWLDKSQKQLLLWPVDELESLRTKAVALNKIPLAKGARFEIKGITTAQADVELTFSIPNLEKAEPFDPSWVDAQQLCGKKDASVVGGIGPFGLLTLASADLEEYTGVFFRVFKSKNKPVVLMCSGGIRSSLNKKAYKPSFGGFVNADLVGGKISLKSLIDNSVVESFGDGGKTCITSRVYPTKAIGGNAHLYAFNNGTEPVQIDNLNAWSMKNPIMN